MTPRLLDALRCPACRGHLVLEEAALTCRWCGQHFAVTGGVPRFAAVEGLADDETARTAASFGYVWGRSLTVSDARETTLTGAGHLDGMLRTLALDPPTGLVLDAGCGAGVDLARQGPVPGQRSSGSS